MVEVLSVFNKLIRCTSARVYAADVNFLDESMNIIKAQKFYWMLVKTLV
jgi:hypothetical protein